MKPKYILKTGDGKFLGNNQKIGSIALALTDNIHLATTFNEGYPPFEMAEKYGKLLGADFTPMEMMAQAAGFSRNMS